MSERPPLTRVEHIAEGVTLYLGDCRDILPTLAKFDAVVTDPPYGLGAKWKGRGAWKLADNGEQTKWDAAPFDGIAKIVETAKHAIVWGGHLYDLPATRGWLIWDKVVRNFSSGDAELAWSTLDQPIKAFSFPTIGLITGNKTRNKVHPTQKPLELMSWCLDLLPRDVSLICDPFMGSGTTGIACIKRGKQFTGIEAHEPYFDIACRRTQAAVDAPDMFVSMEAAPPKQEAFEL